LLALEQELKDNPYNFEFFQAVRLLHRLMAHRKPVGGFASPHQEAVRFAANSSLAFPASQIQQMHWPDGASPLMVVNFMGLTGPSGVLPRPYSELVIERLAAKPKDTALESFINIFNHRMISLFYGAWERYRFPVRYESENWNGDFSRRWAALIGLGTPGLAERQHVVDSALLFYAGIFGLHTRSATALQHVLADYFDIPVVIEQFVGAWSPIDASSQCLFQDDGGYSEQLGSAIVGDEVWDQGARARICLGPLSREQYRRFLPEGSAHSVIRAITQFFRGNEIEFELQLILHREHVPGCELTGLESPQLGWDTWMKSTSAFDRDPGDTVFLLN